MNYFLRSDVACAVQSFYKFKNQLKGAGRKTLNVEP